MFRSDVGTHLPDYGMSNPGNYSTNAMQMAAELNPYIEE
jgi:hypothetical protein